MQVYLINTEDNKDMRGFLELVKWGSELKSEKSTSRKLEQKKVCAFYDKSLK